MAAFETDLIMERASRPGQNSDLYYLTPDLRQKYKLDENPKTFNKSADLVSARIDWEPNQNAYEARTAQRLKRGGLKTTLPSKWPTKLESPLSWSTSDFLDEEIFVVRLSDSEKEEIDAALKHFQGLKIDLSEIDKETFPLPHMATRFEQLAIELHNGRGFFVLRGLDAKKYSGEENAIIFVGISAYIAEERGRQDSSGNMLAHILDIKDPIIDPKERQAVFTTLAQPFHNDVVCDILALHTRGTAAKGGRSIIASAYTVYNELATTRPDLIHELAAPNWTFDTFGRIPAYHQRPILFWHNGKMILNFSRRLLTGSLNSPRTVGLPPITEAQAEALDAVHFIAAKHSLAMEMQLGDFRFINNLAILHCRDAFEDGGADKRHLVRMWLRNEKLAWDTPTPLKMFWERVYKRREGKEQIWEVDGIVSQDHIINKRRSCGQG